MAASFILASASKFVVDDITAAHADTLTRADLVEAPADLELDGLDLTSSLLSGRGPRTCHAVGMLTVEPLTAGIGAEIAGVDLADDLSPDVIEEIREILLEWKVVFFRDQHRLDRAAHVAFGRRFGELEVHPITPADQEQPEVFVIPAGGKFRAPDSWHSDVTWRPEPSMGSILRAVTLPPLGGDTLWADMARAYELLDDETKERIDGRRATHDYASAFGRNQPPEVQERMRAEHPTVDHPIVRTHPETGRKTLYVNVSFTRDDRRHGPRAEPAAAPPPVPAVHHRRRAVPVPLAPRLRRLLGQPGHPAHRRQRLPPRQAGHGARHRGGGQARVGFDRQAEPADRV